MKNIAISTTSFGRYDKTPLELIKDAGYQVLLNPHGR